MPLRRMRVLLLAGLLAQSAVISLAAEPAPPLAAADVEALSRSLEKVVAILQGKVPAYTVTLVGRYKDGALEQAGELAIARLDAEQFRLAFKSDLLSFTLQRTRAETSLVVPLMRVAVVGKGPLPAESELQPARLFDRIAGLWPAALSALGVMQTADPGAVAVIIQALLQLERPADAPAGHFIAKRDLGGGRLTIELAEGGQAIRQFLWRGAEGLEAGVGVAIAEEAKLPATSPAADFVVVSVARDELERALGRGLGRAAEILAQRSGDRLKDDEREADRGRLVIRNGQRVALLQGTPLEVGYQHGKLLASEARRTADSVLYVAGLYHTLTKRTWFLDVLRGAYVRLEPHVPREYLDEMQGLANGSGLTPEEARLANMFPELFHCSGFALFGKATAGGKLLHGRVLDYVTELGFQREAVVFIVKKRDAIPFANIGYAGFIGSVSGMNAEQVAFGEMGGRGEGQWDGTPMAILMRMGLERAKTLDDAVALFRDAKRTCEYYYVISDGKGPSAVGVGATPEAIEFVKPGAAHPKLPTPLDDTVLLSAGDRYKHLVEGVKARYGQFDVQAALGLMKRPVAMRSNLHNVLFVPQDLEFHVANARGGLPACDQPYARYSLREWLDEMARPRPERGGKRDRKRRDSGL